MLGADHHGYIARLKAAAAAFGDDPDIVEVLIGQMVNLVRDGEPVRMSKRAGTVITLDDLVEALGVDAARYALIRSSVDTEHRHRPRPVDGTTNDNPVFYVQYAHARLASLARNAADLGLGTGRTPTSRCSPHEREAELIARSASTRASSPAPPSCASRTGSPATSRTSPAPTTSSTTRAACCRWATKSHGDLHTARLALCAADPAGAGQRPGLLGVTAPERM